MGLGDGVLGFSRVAGWWGAGWLREGVLGCVSVSVRLGAGVRGG